MKEVEGQEGRENRIEKKNCDIKKIKAQKEHTRKKEGREEGETHR